MILSLGIIMQAISNLVTQ